MGKPLGHPEIVALDRAWRLWARQHNFNPDGEEAGTERAAFCHGWRKGLARGKRRRTRNGKST